MAKCSKCNKLVSKKCPGLQCGKCTKWLHADCVSISTDQLAVLSMTDSVDWKCKACTGSIRQKRVSCITAEEEDDNTDSEHTQSVVNKGIIQEIMQQIRVEVREVIRNELQRTLEFYSDKIDEYEAKIIHYEEKMKEIENKQVDMRNSYKNLEMRNQTLEQKINNIEQNLLINQFEIAGVKEEENENLDFAITNLCVKINKKKEDIVKIYRKKKKSSTGIVKESPIVVILREGCREQWMEAAKKNTNISAKDLGRADNTRIYIRESLTPATSYLLWKSKTDLKNICKYIWCKKGIVMARKDDQDKHQIIRSTNDVDRLVSLYSKKL